MRVVIDRFEGEFAVVELPTGDFVNMARELIPEANEGDIIDITINHDETQKQSERIEELMKKLFED